MLFCLPPSRNRLLRGKSTERAQHGSLLEASPLKRLLGFYSPLDFGLPLGPAVFFCDACVESVKTFLKTFQ
jgi:hypothetical protein